MTDPEELAKGLIGRDRRALARAITLIESSRAQDRAVAWDALSLVDRSEPTIRIGVSGPPGVGKSTFIEAFGQLLIDLGHRVAVLAVDPTSQITGGSILGDKTRMSGLANSPDAFIRPSPAGSTLGGVALRTGDAIDLCEAAGYDVVIVETVGVGQSETEVANLTDLLILLVAPSGGDELQGIKRGVMELADIVAVNKADGDLAPTARSTASEYQAALHVVRPKFADRPAHVALVSSREGSGMRELHDVVAEHHEWLTSTGRLERLRGDQAVARMWQVVRRGLEALLAEHDDDDRLSIESEVRAGRVSPGAAASLIVESIVEAT